MSGLMKLFYRWTSPPNLCFLASCVQGLSGTSQYRCKLAPSPLKTLPCQQQQKQTPQDNHMARIKNGVGEFFTSFSSRDERLAHAVSLFAFARKHRVRVWELEEMEQLYDILQFQLLFSSTAQMSALLAACRSSDPLSKSAAEVLLDRIDLNEIDLTLCNLLCWVCINQGAPGQFNPKVIYDKLQGQLLSKIDRGEAEMDGKNMSSAVNALYRASYLSSSTATKVAEYLSSCLHMLELKHASLILATLALSRHLNRIRDAEFFNAANAYCLNILEDVLKFSVEERLEHLGERYGFCLGGFLIFYTLTGAYNRKVCDKMVALFLGPRDPMIHSPHFSTKLATMCSYLRYHRQELLESIERFSVEDLESFSLKNLSKTLQALVNLNYKHGRLLSAATSRVLRSTSLDQRREDCDVYWSLINSCVFLNHYPPQVLERFTTDKMMEGKLSKIIMWYRMSKAVLTQL